MQTWSRWAAEIQTKHRNGKESWTKTCGMVVGARCAETADIQGFWHTTLSDLSPIWHAVEGEKNLHQLLHALTPVWIKSQGIFFSTLLNLCHQELKLFWKDGYNGVQPGNNNMYVGVFVLSFFNNHPSIQRPPFVQFRVASCSSHELDVPFISISLFIYFEREKSK